MSSDIRAVFFDLGGTLFSNRTIPLTAGAVLVEAGKRLGVEGKLQEVGIAYVKASMRANERYVDQPFYMHRDLFHETYRHFAEELGKRASDDFIAWLYEEQRVNMVEKMYLRDDCIATLQSLRGSGLTLSIVSNIDDDYLQPMVRSLELESHIDHWTSSEEARSCKPHSGIFDLALQKAGCEANEVVFVGDSREHDVKGARRAGMKAVLISEEDGKSPLDVGDAEPDHVIGELSELNELLSR
jgi:2-haloalkanoic acid dehalogenase type II